MLPVQRVRILVATRPVDFCKGHDGLAALVQSVLKEDPLTVTARCQMHHAQIIAEH